METGSDTGSAGETGSDSGSDTAKDTGTAAKDTACALVEGSGCTRLTGEPAARTCDSADTANSTGDSDAGRVEGGACGGASVSGGLSLALLSAVLWRRLRVGVAFIVVTALLHGDTALAGVDAQTFHPEDGGPFPTLVEADLGPAWSPAGNWSHTLTKRPLVYVDNTGVTELLSDVYTVERALSLNLGGYLRAGFSWPVNRWAVADGRSYTDQSADIRLWASIPLHQPDADGQGWAAASTVTLRLATGTPTLFLGDSNGGVEARGSVSRVFGAWTGLANLSVDLHAPVDIPGATWGNRLGYGVGMRRQIYGPVQGSAELLGSLPLSLASNAALYPLEGVGAVQGLFGRGLRITVGGGTGFTHGVGSPAWRAFASVGFWPPETVDSDQDGVPDTRDRCRTDPEDRDLYHDLDGCPDPDNDGDKILDTVDACRNEAEVYNGYVDDDGCPDNATLLHILVRGEVPSGLERATLTVGEAEAQEVLSGEPLDIHVAPGPLRIAASAAGYHPVSRLVGVGDGPEQTVEVVLAPVRLGALHLRATDTAGLPIPARLRLGDQVQPVPAEGATLPMAEGEQALRVEAAGYRPAQATVEIVPEQTAELTLALQPLLVRLEDGALIVSDEIAFAVDKADLVPESLPSLDDVAALLAAHPEIRLLRIEGHADDTGTPAYNLDLSRKRAEAVRAHLVGAGVAPERLEALGSGEAKTRADATASRRVEFLVLVWDEPGPKPETPKGR